MAVYKATYCYPFLTSYDTRLAAKNIPLEPNYKPVKWLSCKIDTSNKDITGYSVRILNEYNEVIFPVNGQEYISPISELKAQLNNGVYQLKGADLLNQERKVNTGLNGTYLNIPFFQSKTNPIIKSANAIYTNIIYRVNYIIRPTSLINETLTEQVDQIDTWIKKTNEFQCNFTGWKGTLNGDYLIPGQSVLVIDTNKIGYICKVDSSGDSANLKIQQILLIKGDAILVDQGSYHNQIYIVGDNSVFSRADATFKTYTDITGNEIDLSNVGGTYKWEVTLYQGDGSISHIANGVVPIIDYNHVNIERYYDMVLAEGTILGSKPGRLQIAFKDNGNESDEILPQNKDGSGVVLYHKWAQLFNSNGADASNRFYVNSYNDSLGHIYPLESDVNTLSLEGVSTVQFFEHSNDPTYITANDRVAVAASRTDGIAQGASTGAAAAPTGNIEMIGIQDLDGVPGSTGTMVLLMHQKQPAENGVYVMTTDVNNSITINSVKYKRDASKDHYVTVGGKNVIWSFGWTGKASSNAEEVTYYTRTRNVRKPVTSGYAGDTIYTDAACSSNSGKKASEVSISTWSRAGSYDEWGDFIGKIIYVESGLQNGHKNFESLATAGGQLLNKPYKTFDSSGNYTYDGSSPLYFVPERPLLLFSQKLADYNVRACGTKIISGNNLVYDDILIKDGQYVLEINNTKVSLMKVSIKDNTATATNVNFNFATNAPHYFYIEEGRTKGHSVVKVAADGTASFDNLDLNTATVLYNKDTRTYITPFINLASKMLLKFKDNYIQLKGQTYKQNYLFVKTANKNLWYITHDALQNPLASYSHIQGNLDNSVPYKYKLNSFYKTSDENPFYLYEDPYIGIYRANLFEEDSFLTQTFKANSTDYIVYNSTKGFNQNGSDFDFSNSSWNNLYDNFVGYNITTDTGESTIQMIDDLLLKTKKDITVKAYYNGAFLHESNKAAFSAPDILNWRATGQSPDQFFNKYGHLWLTGFQNAEFPTSANAPTTEIETALVVGDLKSGYRLNLVGLYNQQQGGSWEAYRWVISKPEFEAGYTFDETSDKQEALTKVVSEKILQDTGRRYDKEINVNFYGLFAQTESKTTTETPYLVHLYLEDNLGNTLHKKEIVVVTSALLSAWNNYLSKFTATLNKRDACVDIEVHPTWRNMQGALIQKGLGSFSIFRREYRVMYKNGSLTDTTTVIGDQWYPVALNIATNEALAASGEISIKVKDYNIKNGYSYQYIIFPNDDITTAGELSPYIYANTPVQFGKTFNSVQHQFMQSYSKPVEVNFEYWSLVELVPNDELIDAPLAESSYTVDPANIWLFKYALDTGSISQTVSKNEINTLGQFNKFGHGLRNILSGSISCQLGSEIVPLSKLGYLERMPYARSKPLTTNDKNEMLLLWRKLAYSKNPKLLRNLKGESWIVQIVESSNTTSNNIFNYPDTIQFSWKQVGASETAIISLVNSDFFDQMPSPIECGPLWERQPQHFETQTNQKRFDSPLQTWYNLKE